MTDYLITIDDRRLGDFGLHLEEGQDHPATPYFQHNTLEIPGMSGVWDFGTKIREKRFSFPLVTNGIDRAEMQQRIKSLVAFLCDDFGNPRNVRWVFDYEPDKFYMAKLAEQIVPDMIKPFTRFHLFMVAHDPYNTHHKRNTIQKMEFFTDKSKRATIILTHSRLTGFMSVIIVGLTTIQTW